MKRYTPDENGKPDRSKSKSALSLLWEEIYGPTIDLQMFAENCWNSAKPIEIEIEDPKELPDHNSILCKPHLKDSGTSSLNDEDQSLTSEKEGHNQCRPHISVKNIVQQFSTGSNGYTKSDTERDRWCMVVRELIETEKIYLRSLTEVEEGYLKISTTTFRDDDEVMTIFSNWKKLRLFHSQFLDMIKSINTCDFQELVRLSQCFNDHVSQFEDLYSEYCINYSQSVKHLHHIETASSQTWQSLVLCQTQLGHQLPLSTFLLKPVQRILKYHLLLKELIQCCKLVQYANVTGIIESLLTALENMVQVANRINERQMKREEQTRLLQLRDELYLEIISIMLNCPHLGQPYLDGELKVPGCKNSRTVLLCQNSLVLAKRLGLGKWDIKQVIQCNQMILFESIPKQPLEFHVVDFNDNKNKATLQALNAEEKERWCKMIKQLIISSYGSNSISERAKRILLDNKYNVLSQNKPTSHEVLDKYHINLNRNEDLFDIESSLRRILDPISNPSFVSAKHKNIKRRNSVGAIKSELKINYRDPSIYQWSNRRHCQIEDDMDCRSIMIDVNEENMCDGNGGDTSVHEQTYERYMEKSRNKVHLTPEDIQEIFQPLQKMQDVTDNSNVLMAEMELASLCSEPDLDSVASDTTHGQHKHKSTSMDRHFGVSLYAKASSFNSSIDTGNPPSEFSNSSNRKKPLFSSARETKTTRSNSDWGSLFDVEAKSGLVKRLFKASAKLTKRDKSKCSSGTSVTSNPKSIDAHSQSKSTSNSETKRSINKSNSTDYIVQSQSPFQRAYSRKKTKAPKIPLCHSSLPNNQENSGASYRIAQQEPQDLSDKGAPVKPPRQLPQFKIEMFDKCKSVSSERLKVNSGTQHHLQLIESLQNSSNSESNITIKVKDLVSIFQSDR